MKITIATIILSIAEQPLRNAAIVAPFGTASPPGGTIPLATNVRRLVGTISAIIIRITVPRFLDTASILASKFGFSVAGP